jgi:hypothetical protein
MRITIVALLCSLAFMIPVISFCQDTVITQRHVNATDTTVIRSAGNTAISKPDDEFNLFLFAFAIAAMCFIAACFFVGLIAAISIIGLSILLISAGIISTSLFIGWYKRSFTTGFKLFWVIGGSVGGLIFGAVSFGVVSHLTNLQLTTANAVLSGGAIGLLTGALVGFMVYKLLRAGFKYVANKFKLLKEKLVVGQ